MTNTPVVYPATSMCVPFVELTQPPAVQEAVDRVVRSGVYIDGPEVNAFEEAWASYCGRRFCVGTGSGTEALTIALRAMSLGYGARVAVPALTFIATWEAVTLAGLTPVPFDVDEDGFIDVAGHFNSTVAAAIPVHLYGRRGDVSRLTHLTPLVLDDACQAHGAGLTSESVAAAYSFYPTKNLGALGDAGALVTDDRRLADRFRALRNHGQLEKDVHEVVGSCGRLDEIQAAVLLAKLPHLPEWNDARYEAALAYNRLLRGIPGVELPDVDRAHSWHLYVIRVSGPAVLAGHLARSGIGTGRHYPVPTHRTPAYTPLGFQPGSFPVAERLAAQSLSLPLWPGITPAQQNEVAHAIRSYFE